MSKAKVNDLFSIEVPEGFHTMSTEELRKAYRDENPNRWGMWDQERHVMVTVMWQEYSRLVMMLADTKAICRKNEQIASKGYANNGYVSDGFFSVKVDGEKAEGYRFSYSVDGVEQSAETILFKLEKTIFTITCGGRRENRETDRELFDRIIDGISLE